MTSVVINTQYPAHKSLADDYLSGAEGFIFASELILANSSQNSVDWFFKLEKPYFFLLGHSAELILKAGLSYRQALDNKIFHEHNLLLLAQNSVENSISIDPNFKSHIENINDNFMLHDHRYQRSFSGFPEKEFQQLMELTKETTPDAKRELKKHGLVVYNSTIPSLFLSACKSQLEIVKNLSPLK